MLSQGVFDKKYFSTGAFGDYKENVFLWADVVGQKASKLLKGIKRPRILDVGCAQGYFLDYLFKKYGFEAFGLEYSGYAISRAVSGLKHKIKQGSVLNPKAFGPNSFDLITCLDVFMYIEEKDIESAAANLVAWAKKYILFGAVYRHSPQASQKTNPDFLRITTLKQGQYIKIFERLGVKFVGKFKGYGEILIFQK